MNRKIAVAGTGYVGLSLAALLLQKNQVRVKECSDGIRGSLIRKCVRK